MANLCNLDGSILPEDEARVPVLDRGFLFGDSVYEVVRTTAGVPFGWPEHFARLRTSAAAIRLELDLDDRELARRVDATVRAAAHGDSYVRIIATRGSGSAPNIGLAYAPGPPRWVVLVRPAPDVRGHPARIALVQRLRNDRRALDPATKSGNYLNNVLALAEAQAAGATDCVMANADGNVTEASTANLFVLLGGVWCTPPLEAGLLAGVTRGLLLGFLRGSSAAVEERNVTAGDLARADEIFLSSTLREISPVTHLDGRELHGGGPGPQTAALAERFAAHCAALLRETYAPRWRALLA